MSEHRVEINDASGQSMVVYIGLNNAASGTWRAADLGYFTYTKGVVETCYSSSSDWYAPTAPLSWVSLYGGNRVDDSKLVLHLDDFCNKSGVGQSGSGKIYFGDTILATPGPVSWQLLSNGFTGL